MKLIYQLDCIFTFELSLEEIEYKITAWHFIDNHHILKRKDSLKYMTSYSFYGFDLFSMESWDSNMSSKSFNPGEFILVFYGDEPNHPKPRRRSPDKPWELRGNIIYFEKENVYDSN